jgi:hypothetical protein
MARDLESDSVGRDAARSVRRGGYEAGAAADQCGEDRVRVSDDVGLENPRLVALRRSDLGYLKEQRVSARVS